MDWEPVKEWLARRGHISDRWEYIEVSDDGIYCSDSFENTFISLYVNGADYLVCFVGCVNPKVYFGGCTDCKCTHYCDVINYLEDELEGLFEGLDMKMRGNEDENKNDG